MRFYQFLLYCAALLLPSTAQTAKVTAQEIGMPPGGHTIVIGAGYAGDKVILQELLMGSGDGGLKSLITRKVVL